jgi:hypothetical protein
MKEFANDTFVCSSQYDNSYEKDMSEMRQEASCKIESKKMKPFLVNSVQQVFTHLGVKNV